MRWELSRLQEREAKQRTSFALIASWSLESRRERGRTTLLHPGSLPQQTRLSTKGRTKGTVKLPVSAKVGLEGLTDRLCAWRQPGLRAEGAQECGLFVGAPAKSRRTGGNRGTKTLHFRRWLTGLKVKYAGRHKVLYIRRQLGRRRFERSQILVGGSED